MADDTTKIGKSMSSRFVERPEHTRWLKLPSLRLRVIINIARCTSDDVRAWPLPDPPDDDGWQEQFKVLKSYILRGELRADPLLKGDIINGNATVFLDYVRDFYPVLSKESSLNWFLDYAQRWAAVRGDSLLRGGGIEGRQGRRLKGHERLRVVMNCKEAYRELMATTADKRRTEKQDFEFFAQRFGYVPKRVVCEVRDWWEDKQKKTRLPEIKPVKI